jgi:hypothetical protein
MMRREVLAFTVLLGLFLAGCGEDTGGRLPVSGNVTFQGSPLKTGTIEFELPDGSHRTGTTITDGKYSIPASQGLIPGTYIVRVSSVESSEAAPAGPPGPESAGAEQKNKNLIPAEFNTSSQLKHDAGPGKPTTFDVTIP